MQDGKRVATICNHEAFEKNQCTLTDLNKFIVQAETDIRYPTSQANRYTSIDARSVAFNVPVLVNATQDNMIHVNETFYEFNYNVQRLGYYCVMYSVLDIFDFEADVKTHIHQPYGRLLGEIYPLWPFYGTVTLVYLIVGLAWVYKSWRHWDDILPVQNWIAGVIFTLMLDNSFYYGFYDFWNSHGYISHVLLSFMVILNAARNAMALFCLLILTLGYGVVRPSLGDEMKKCVAMGVALFASFLTFDIGSQMVRHDTSISLWIALLVIMPLALSVTITLSWSMSALVQTLKYLKKKRQNYKVRMYTML